MNLPPDVLHAVDPTRTPPPIATRLAGVSCVTFAMIIHGTRPAWGVRLQNSLGVLKLIALCAIALSGLAALARLPGFKLEEVRPQSSLRSMSSALSTASAELRVVAYVGRQPQGRSKRLRHRALHRSLVRAHVYSTLLSLITLTGPSSGTPTQTMHSLRSATPYGRSSSRRRWPCSPSRSHTCSLTSPTSL